jgi:ribosomal peptide maturation radical SAM protein 1
MTSVLLASMPFAALDRPALGLGLLQAELHERGFECETRYLSFTFADCIGVEDYVWVHRGLPYTAFAGDWTFTESLYGTRSEADAGYVRGVLHQEWRLGAEDVARLMRVRSWCEPYLRHCLDAVPWGDYDVVGFTSTFEQNIASLSMARRVKAAHPHVAIAFGGANWEGAMGRELHRRFPFVDFVLSGEADRSFPALVAALGNGGGIRGIKGLVWRDGARTRANGPAPLVTDMDALPYPDFDPFFRDRAAGAASTSVGASMLAETGRGCWWGEKSHCKFCGLNGGGMRFRSKSPERAVAELRHLRDRYGIEAINIADNILDMDYFRTVLPVLATEGPELSLFYEVKANLKREQVALLAAAGVHAIQPGLESMSDHVLKLMRKGTTALRNVQLLKWCREHGVLPEWNVLYGFPGEEPEDYAGMPHLFEEIWFLDPPSGYGPVRLDRFSPYHQDPAGNGMINVRPMGPYPYLYPFPRSALMRIAYYFDYDYADGREPLAYAGETVEKVRSWMADKHRGALTRVNDGDGIVVLDDRAPAPRRTLRLRGWRARAYDACDRARSLSGLARDPALGDIAPDVLQPFLDRCVDARLMMRSDDSYLALAVHSPARTWSNGGPAHE